MSSVLQRFITNAINKATLTANSILYAVSAEVPAALSVAASRIVGRKASGDIAALTGAEVREIEGTAPFVIGSDADGDMYYRASSALARLAKGTAYQILAMKSDASKPEWVSDPLSPWLVDVNVFNYMSHSNWPTLVANSSQVMGGYRQSAGGKQNAYVTFPVVLSAGTWTFALIHYKNTDVGIYTVKFDDDTVGTIDGYNAGGAVANTLSEINNISVTVPGKKIIKIIMATKNAGSSSYYGIISAIRFYRTA